MIECPNPSCRFQLADGAKFCPKCGAKISTTGSGPRGSGPVKVDPVRPSNPTKGLETNRSLGSYIFRYIITCGLYSYFFIYSLAKDVNVACEGDGQKTRGFLGFVFLSLITCGFYSLVWQYSIANRLAENARKYDLHFQENGTTVLLWASLNVMTLFMSSFMIINILIKNTNRICEAYNKAHGL